MEPQPTNEPGSSDSERPASKASRGEKVAALSLGQGLTNLVGIATTMVLARVLTKGDYATFRQTFLAFNFVAPILILGIPGALYYFLPGEKSRTRGRVSDCLVVFSALSILFAVFLLLGGAKLLAWRFSNPELEETLYYLIPFPFLALPLRLVSSVLVIRERVVALGVFNILSRAAIGIAVIATVLIWRSYTAPIIGQVAVYLPVAAMALVLTFRSLPKDSWLPRVDSILELLKFSLPLGLSSMIGTIVLQLDKVIVSSMCTPEEFAVYANGAMEIPLVGIITGSITAVVLADMRKSVVRGNLKEAVRLFRATAEKSSYILFPAMLFLLIAGDSFVETIFSEKYSASVHPFRIYLAMLPLRTVVFGSLILALGKTKMILIRTGVSLVLNTGLSLLFVWLWGSIGAAIATVAVLWLWATPFNLYVLSKNTGTRWYDLLPFAHMGKCVAFLLIPGALTIAARFLVADQSSLVRLITQMAVFGLVVLLWWNGKLYRPKDLLSRLQRLTRRKGKSE